MSNHKRKSTETDGCKGCKYGLTSQSILSRRVIGVPHKGAKPKKRPNHHNLSFDPIRYHLLTQRMCRPCLNPISRIESLPHQLPHSHPQATARLTCLSCSCVVSTNHLGFDIPAQSIATSTCFPPAFPIASSNARTLSSPEVRSAEIAMTV